MLLVVVAPVVLAVAFPSFVLPPPGSKALLCFPLRRTPRQAARAQRRGVKRCALGREGRGSGKRGAPLLWRLEPKRGRYNNNILLCRFGDFCLSSPHPRSPPEPTLISLLMPTRPPTAL